MAIGLSSEQLLGEAMEAVDRRLDELSGEMGAAAVGESPAFAEMVTKFVEKYPQLPPEAWLGAMVLTRALMDVIEANNRAIAAAVPHVEPAP